MLLFAMKMSFFFIKKGISSISPFFRATQRVALLECLHVDTMTETDIKKGIQLYLSYIDWYLKWIRWTVPLFFHFFCDINNKIAIGFYSFLFHYLLEQFIRINPATVILNRNIKYLFPL